MPNEYTGEVTVTVDDKEYSLRLDINKAVELEGMGHNLIGGLPSGFAAMRDVFFVCLKGQHGIASKEDTGVFMQVLGDELSSTYRAVTSLFFQSLSPKKEETEEK